MQTRADAGFQGEDHQHKIRHQEPVFDLQLLLKTSLRPYGIINVETCDMFRSIPLKSS